MRKNNELKSTKNNKRFDRDRDRTVIDNVFWDNFMKILNLYH